MTQRMQSVRHLPCAAFEWREYFEQNTRLHDHICWEPMLPLDEAELRAVARSIQVFQLGESGEGRHFLAYANREAERSGDWDYMTALRLFLHEEQRHARYLGEVLQANQIAPLKHNWTDGIFRWLRHRAGLELTIMVLLAAELIAQVYYQALRDATANPRLRQICRIILRDEQSHVRFQSERLAQLRVSHSRAKRFAIRGFEQCLFLATLIVVWFTHRPVFRAAKMSWSCYWKKLWRCFQRSQEFARVQPENPAVDRPANQMQQDFMSLPANHHFCHSKWLD